MKNLVGRTWAIATQIKREVILKKIQLPKDSQTMVSGWGLARGQGLHRVSSGIGHGPGMETYPTS